MHDSNLTEERLYARLTALRREERAALLERETADDWAMRARLENRLQAYDRLPGDDTVTASNPDPMAEPVVAAPADETIGRYKLRQKLGEGGCGVVYLAEQAEPVRRRVALKVIKLGMDTKVVIARFEAERQALALMDHPNIAKVFDAGTTDAGRPYFVMELVRGVRLTDYCDQQGVTTRGRIELFIQVCGAIQHAHQKGIIHRDLKPSNILVAVQDGMPMPKVIDFGIAKSIHGRLADATVFTGFEQFIGTPAYMSPEQAELSGVDIDTRTDIYSLGVVLYELLTGRLPLDPKTLTESGLDEIRRLIREVDPPRPSTRLGTMTEVDFTNVAKRRGAAPSLLSAEVRGDLDWIVMKAIEKQRNRRYESAAALAADLTRHLQDEPVLARPPSAVYRTRKFVTRHKVAAVATAAVALALVAGTVVSTWQAVRARRAERVAQGEREEARRSQDRAEDLLAFMLGDLRTQLEKVGRLDVLEAVGEKAMAYFASLNPRELTDATLTRQAKALTQLGEIRKKQKRYAEALQAFTGAYERSALLASRHARDVSVLFERGQAEFGLGDIRRLQGESIAAKEWLMRYRVTAETLAAIEPGRSEWQQEVTYGLHNLAVLKKDEGDLAGARADFAAKLEIIRTMSERKPADLRLKFRITDTESWLGSLAEQAGDFGRALAHFETEARGLEELQRIDPDDLTWRYEWADSLSLQARILSITGKNHEAAKRLGEARKLIDRATAHDPGNRSWAECSYRIRLREATIARGNGDRMEAARLAASARVGFEALLEKAPKDTRAIAGLSAALRTEAELHATEAPTKAKAAIGRMLMLGDELVRLESRGVEAISQQAQLLVAAAQIEVEQGSTETALGHAARAFELTAPHIERSNDWRLLDPAVRAGILLGKREQNIRLQSRLEKLGYVSLLPWPPGAPVGSRESSR